MERLAAAYEEALQALRISDRDDPINEVIAQRIIEGARTGVRDYWRQTNIMEQQENLQRTWLVAGMGPTHYQERLHKPLCG
jgi:hypothetical protein